MAQFSSHITSISGLYCVSILCPFWDMQRPIMACPWSLG